MILAVYCVCVCVFRFACFYIHGLSSFPNNSAHAVPLLVMSHDIITKYHHAQSYQNLSDHST